MEAKDKNKLRKISGIGFDVVIMIAVLCSQVMPLGALLYPQDQDSRGISVAQASASGWYDANYAYRREMVIDHTKVSNTDQADFPVLVSLTQDFLKASENGGKVESLSGYDIVFMAGDGTTPLSHELEKYDAATGELKAWVKIPDLSASTDTRFYMYYGNADVVASQQDVSGVWDESGSGNADGVWHLGEDPAGTAPQIDDSTSNANDLASSGMEASNSVAGQVAGALGFDGTDDYLQESDNPSLDFTTRLTLSMWVKSRFEAADVFALGGKTCGGGGAQDHHYMLSTNGPLLQFVVGSGDCATETSVNDSLSKTGFFSGYENKWVYVTATFDGGAMKLYRNGVLQASKTSAITVLKSSSDDFEIGRYPNYPGFYILGSIDEVRASSVARSADWIKTEYNSMMWPNDFYAMGAEEMAAPLPLSRWGYRKEIVIDRTKVSGSLVDFPVLVSFDLDGDLASHAQADGGDILFTSADVGWENGTQGERLSHEIESFDPATGKLVAWVRMPSLSSSNDTVIHMYYGNSTVSNQQDKTAVWDGDAQMVQHMGWNPAGTGPQLIDSTVHANDGTAAGDMTSANEVAGIWGKTMYFDGTDDLFSIISSPSLEIKNEITLEAWMKSSDTWNGRNIVGKNYAYGLYCAYPNSLRGYIYSGGWKTANSVQGLFNTSNWYHYAVAYNPGDGVIKVYLNGQEVAYSSQGATSGLINSNSYPVYVGQAIGGGTFFGRLEEARISASARSADWFATEYANGSDPSHFYEVGIEQVLSPQDLSGWKYRKAITVDHARVAGGVDLENFPVLVNLPADADLAAGAKPDGNDIIFTASSVPWEDGTSNARLFHEIEDYDPATGSLAAWVKIPVLSAGSDTVINMYYGNAAASYAETAEGGVWDGNFKMVQHLGDDPTSTSPQFADSTSNGHDGTGTGSMTADDSVAGRIGSAVDLDAVDDYIDVGGGSTLNSYPLTLKAWVRTSGSGTNRGIITKYAAASSNGYQLYINNGRIKAWYFNSSANYTRQDADADDGGLVNDGLWHQVVYRVDGSGGSIFVDGVLKNTKAWTGSAKGPTTTQAVQLGKYNFLFNGALDEVRISDSARSDGWIGTEYNNEADSAFLALAAPESYMDHFRLTGNAAQAAGAAQTLTLSAISRSGSVDTGYAGDKDIVLGGVEPINGYVSTFTDKNGDEIAFGSSGTVAFAAGIATTSVKLYRAGAAEIDMSDGVFSSAGDGGYDLDVDVSGAVLGDFELSAPASVTSETTFPLTVTAKDAYGNDTEDVSSATRLSVDAGRIDTTSLAASEFSGDAYYGGNPTISEIAQDRNVVLTATNGSISKSVTLAVIGVSHGSFLPPAKPDMAGLVLAYVDGRIVFSGLPDAVAWFAVSPDPDFAGASWEACKGGGFDPEKFPDYTELYVKFMAKSGAVSDVVVYRRSSAAAQLFDEGDIVKSPDSPDVYIIKYKNGKQFKRLILSPSVFSSYLHLRWDNLKTVLREQLDSFVTSSLVRVKGDSFLYQLTPLGDTGKRRAVAGSETYDQDSVYEINEVDRDSYILDK